MQFIKSDIDQSTFISTALLNSYLKFLATYVFKVFTFIEYPILITIQNHFRSSKSKYRIYQGVKSFSYLIVSKVSHISSYQKFLISKFLAQTSKTYAFIPLKFKLILKAKFLAWQLVGVGQGSIFIKSGYSLRLKILPISL